MQRAEHNSSTDTELAHRANFLHAALEQWLAEPGITIACGQWGDGAISEMVPNGQAQLLAARYEGRFAGVRELRLADASHHIHLDLGRVHRLSYTVAPSVCLDFRPSMEVRLLTTALNGMTTDRWLVAVMLSSPYINGEVDRATVARFFALAREHAALRPDLVEVSVEEPARQDATASTFLAELRAAAELPQAGWDEALEALCAAPAGQYLSPLANAEPLCLALLEQALALADASLVIFRERTLVEFKTERLGGLHRYEEEGNVSWQIGGHHDHHCHLALDTVYAVEFSAEPVSCQGGGINYTVWFLTRQPAGNPYRRDGYFSVVLNRPYSGNAPRRDIIGAMLDLYRRFEAEPWVTADTLFREAISLGPTARDRQRNLPGAMLSLANESVGDIQVA